MSELKPCPYCGSTDMRVKPVWQKYWFVACSNCKAGGPVSKTQTEAMERWNARYEQTCTIKAVTFDPDDALGAYDGCLCSNCGEIPDHDFIAEGNLLYCPFCGAKVIGYEWV